MPLSPTVAGLLSCGHWIEFDRQPATIVAMFRQQHERADLVCDRCPASTKAFIHRILVSSGEKNWVEL